jgi:hypothetical protein
MLSPGLRGESPLVPFLELGGLFGILTYENYYQNLLHETLFLVKNGFSYQDVMIMASHVRKYFVNSLAPKE